MFVLKEDYPIPFLLINRVFRHLEICSGAGDVEKLNQPFFFAKLLGLCACLPCSVTHNNAGSGRTRRSRMRIALMCSGCGGRSWSFMDTFSAHFSECECSFLPLSIYAAFSSVKLARISGKLR